MISKVVRVLRPLGRVATRLTVVSCVVVGTAVSAAAAEKGEPSSVLITNARIFDGVNEGLADADLILVEGNSLENLDLVADPHTNFVVIMKDGKVYKNTLD